MALRARDVMTTHVVSVPPTLPLARLEDALVARHFGGAPVVEDERLVGIVSRSDVVRYFTIQRSLHSSLGSTPASAGREDAERHLTVRDVMAHDPIVAPPEAPIGAVARLMVEHHVHRIVITEAGAVVGLITALDIVELVANGRMAAA